MSGIEISTTNTTCEKSMKFINTNYFEAGEIAPLTVVQQLTEKFPIPTEDQIKK